VWLEDGTWTGTLYTVRQGEKLKVGLFLLVFAVHRPAVAGGAPFAVLNLSFQRFASELGALHGRNEQAQLNSDVLDFLIGGKGR
jgi:hypothetical protein